MCCGRRGSRSRGKSTERGDDCGNFVIANGRPGAYMTAGGRSRSVARRLVELDVEIHKVRAAEADLQA
jgi:hypothetical protein